LVVRLDDLSVLCFCCIRYNYLILVYLGLGYIVGCVVVLGVMHFSVVVLILLFMFLLCGCLLVFLLGFAAVISVADVVVDRC